MNKNRKSYFLGTFATVVIVASSIGVWLLVSQTGDPFSQRSFEHQLWLAWPEQRSDIEEPNPRGFMANDLLENWILEGMSRETVLALLGPPDSYYSEGISYYLGGHSGGFLLPGRDYLIIEFDVESRVIEASIVKSD